MLARMRGLLVVLALAALGVPFGTACGGKRYFVIEEPPDVSQKYLAFVCDAKGNCQQDPATDEARWNQNGTVHIVLPKDCNTRIQRMRIDNTDDPQVLVECATGQTTLPTTSADGGTPGLPTTTLPTTTLPPKPSP